MDSEPGVGISGARDAGGGGWLVMRRGSEIGAGLLEDGACAALDAASLGGRLLERGPVLLMGRGG
jgi:hypothetical protein